MAKILIVDDLLPNIKLLEAKLIKEYYDVYSARGGKEALEILNQENIDVVLLDVMMPEMDGFETCRRIKANAKTANIPVVIVTALGDVQDRVNGLKAGADDFITKPIVDASLYARIRSLVRLKNIMDELQAKGQLGVGNVLNGKREKDSESPISGAKILMINDDVTEINYLKSLFERYNPEIREMTDLGQDINLFLSKDLDLIIISTQLIKEDGLRICAKIKNIDNMRDVALIILVEEGDEEVLVKGLDMGVNDYIMTPFDENEALVRVTTQIKRKKFQDVLKQHFQQNISLATKDQLTGLYNRHYYNARVKQLYDDAIKDGKPLSMMIIDLDHFKQVNDTYGHLVGDEILKETADRITAHVRATDLVARFGGEEFIVVLPNTTLDNAVVVAERIRSAIEENPYTITHKEGSIKKTASAGVALLKLPESMESLLNRADKGLYIAKEGGRNMVVPVKN
jgi:two-component system, cell cycle response regulator